MLEKIKNLEGLSRGLEPDENVRAELTDIMLQYSEDFLQNIPVKKAYQNRYDSDFSGTEAMPKDIPENFSELVEKIKEAIDTPGINPASGRHFGYIPGGGIFHAAVGDFMAAVSNRYAGIYYASPGAVRLENSLIKWMAGITGYPENSGGNLTSGGSISNLISIVTARDARNLNASEFNRAVVYMTGQTHHSIDKALRIAGLKECIKHYIPVDKNYRMIPEELDAAINADKKAGHIPWLVIASAGTTDTGAVDPLKVIGEVSSSNNLWYHIDGAYGAFFVLSETGKKILEGMDKSDSIIMDPHKGLFLPYGTGAVLVKDAKKLLNSHYYEANYMQDSLIQNAELSPADLSPELSRHFRGLRMWLPLKLAGIRAFGAALEEKILLARYAYDKIMEIEGAEMGPYPDLSVVTFRIKPKTGSTDAFNKRLLDEILKDGRVFLTSTMLDKKFTIRMAVLSSRSHLEDVETAIKIIKELSARLMSE